MQVKIITLAYTQIPKSKFTETQISINATILTTQLLLKKKRNYSFNNNSFNNKVCHLNNLGSWSVVQYILLKTNNKNSLS